MKKLKRLQDRIVRYLESRGAKRISSKSAKYITLQSSSAPETYKYFVGKKGAIRKGRIASDSISVTGMIQFLMEEWKENNND